MTVELLSPERAASLRSAPLSSTPRPWTGGTGIDGLTHLRRTRVLVRRDLDAAAHDLLEWRMHSRAGLRVAASDVPLREGTVVVLRWGRGRAALRVPCRVTEVVDEPGRRGFAYATLPGHPEAGQERFLLERLDDGRLRLAVEAYSRPASTLARLGGPVTRRVQDRITVRYLEALDRL